MHQYRIDTDADHDEKRLKAQRKQGAQIVLSHLSPLAVDHGCHRDGRDRGDHVDFDHSPIGDDEDADAQRPGDDADQRGLEPQTEQRPDVHIHEPGFDIAHQLADVHRGVADDDARRLVDHMLRHVKHAHDDVPGIRHDEHRSEGLEHPLEEDERVEIVHVVAVNQHLDQLQAHDEGQDDAGDGNHDVLGQTFDHAEDAAIPRLRRSAYCSGDIRHLGIDAVKQP